MNKIEYIFDYLNRLIPNPKCELDFNKDYELIIAVMLSAQSTDRIVNSCTRILFSKYPTLKELSKANIEDITIIIKPVGLTNSKSKNVIGIAKAVYKNGGEIPQDREFLENLPGVGRKTANVVLGMLFNEPCIAVDTHIARVSKRLGLCSLNDNVLRIEEKLTKQLHKDNMIKYHHLLLLFGRYYCKAVKPNCSTCELINICKEKRKSI